MAEYAIDAGRTLRLETDGGLIWMTLVDRDGHTLVNRVLGAEDAEAIAGALNEQAGQTDKNDDGRVHLSRVLRDVLGE